MSSTEQYTIFKAKQTKLADMLAQSSEIISELNMKQFRENLKQYSEKVQNDTFKVLVVGSFSNGKSTVINSLLGEDVLPAYALPCTAVINEVRYGEKKKAVLYFKNPLPARIPSEISEKAMRHMQRHGMKNVPPIEVPYEEIEDYVVIPMGKDPSEACLESPYEKIELFWPLDILKNGVEIIDSPGLNESSVRTKVTMEYLAKADAVLMVLSASHLLSQTEMEFIKNNLKGQTFEEPFFLINFWDLISARERPRMMDYAKMHLRNYTNLGDNGIFFISGRDALEGKLSGDMQLLDKSGMPDFEKALSKYLTDGKGKAKLTQPAKELKRILYSEAMLKVIPSNRKMLSGELEEIKARYEGAKPKLEALKMKKEQIYNRLLLRIEQLKPEIRMLAGNNSVKLIDNIPVWVDEAQITTSLNFPTRDKINSAIKEISDAVTVNIEKHQQDWRTNTFIPVIQQKADMIFDSVESDLTKLFEEMDDVQMKISGMQSGEVEEIPTWKRIAGVVGGLALSDVGLAFSGGVNGIGAEFAKTLALEVGAGLVLGFMGMLNPITLLMVLAGTAIFNIGKAESNAVKKVKAAVVSGMTEQISTASEQNIKDMTDSIINKFTEVAGQIGKAIDVEINETEDQVKAIIEEMEKGQESIDEQNRRLDDCENRINGMISDIDNLVFELI